MKPMSPAQKCSKNESFWPTNVYELIRDQGLLEILLLR